LDCTIAGVIDSADVDCFGVALRKGQRLSAEVQAVRLGGEMTDTLLTVYAPDGRRLTEIDDTSITRQDPFASLVAAADGVYTIVVRDAGSGGGPSSTYALHLGGFPRPTGIFPPGVQAGKPVRLKLLGAACEELAQTLIPPTGTGPWWDVFPAQGERTAPTPVSLRVRNYACFEEPDPTEVSPLSDRPEARDCPVAFHGVIGGRGDVDAFAIKANAGKTIQVEVFAARVGSPLDPILEVYDPDGDLVGQSDDDATHDSRLSFQAQADGPHRLVIRDKRLDGGAGYLYRIEVEEPRPSLTVFLAEPVRKTQARQTIAVPRGNRVLAHLGVRRDGFRGPVRVDFGTLPVGVSVDLAEIPEDTYLAPVVFEAAGDAPLGASLVALEGIASMPAGKVIGGFAQVVDLLPGAGDSSFASTTLDKLAVAVVEAAPLRVSLDPPAGLLAQDGAIEIPGKVERAKGFDEPIEISLPYLPPGVEMDGPAIVPSGQHTALLRLFARQDADPVSWRLAAEARLAPPRLDRREMTLALMAQIDPAGARRRRPAGTDQTVVSSKFVPLDLGPAPVAGRLDPVVAEQGSSATIPCTIEHASRLPAGMVAALEGLPPRAEATVVPVDPGAPRVEFRVKLAPDAPVGRYDSLVCRLTGQVGGRLVVYRIGRGGRLEIHTAGALLKGGDGKPLSPLDALRAREATAAKQPVERAHER
jgi:hypothetical protein